MERLAKITDNPPMKQLALVTQNHYSS